MSSVIVSTSICISSCVESAAFSLVCVFSLECLHFILRFWNQTLTWASVRPKVAASWRRSGFVMYFCSWNRRSNPFRCRLLNTARDHDLFLLFWLFWPIDKLVLMLVWEWFSGGRRISRTEERINHFVLLK